MASPSLIPAGDFRTTYASDATIFPTPTSRNAALVGIVLICFAPLVFTGYWLSILIQIGIFAIASLGLNILVGFTGQISIGHAAFFAGIAGALYAHYQLVVSQEGFGIERSILFLAMVIIGGTGSIMGTLMGTAFVVLLPESMEWISASLKGSAIDKALSLNTNITFLREIAIGLIIIAFLMFEPDGLAHRWRQIKTYWKLYPFSH